MTFAFNKRFLMRVIRLHMSAGRILTIEDDPDIAALLRLELEEAGYEVLQADNGMTGLLQAREETPDLILLDLGLPDFDGSHIVKRLRITSTMRIIVLTARDDVTTKVQLLDLGADDYVTKPFHANELLARIRLQIRPKHDRTLHAGRITLHPARGVAYCGEAELRLSETEFNLLHALMRQPGLVLSRQTLNEQVWQGRPLSSNLIDVHVTNLRNKLREVNAHGVLRTVRGLGYAIRET